MNFETDSAKLTADSSAILDEAAGLPDPLWDAVAGVVTSATSRQLAIGNPDSRGGRFEKCFEPGSGWEPIHVPVTASPAFTAWAAAIHWSGVRATPARIVYCSECSAGIM